MLTLTNNTQNRGNSRLRRLLGAALLTAALTGAAHAAPNMVVRINGSEVATNFESNFGEVVVGDAASLVVVLRNESSEDLLFSEDPPVILAGGFPDQFEIIQPALEFGNKLSPNGSTAFRVDFKPSLRLANLFSHVYIYTNAGASPFHIVVRGQGAGPQMFVHQAGNEIQDVGTFTFDDTEAGSTIEREFVIENLGEADLVLTENPPVFLAGGLGEFVMSVTQQPDAIVAPGDSTSFRIEFAPDQERLYTTRLFIYVNQVDADVNGLFDIDLLGNGLAVPPDSDPNEPAIDEPNQPTDTDPNDGLADDDTLGDPNDGLGDDDSDNSGIDDEIGGDTGVDNGGQDNAGGNNGSGDTGADDQGGLGSGGQSGDELTNEAESDDLETLEPIAPTGLCGFGVGFASLAGLVSLGGVRGGRKLRRRLSAKG